MRSLKQIAPSPSSPSTLSPSPAAAKDKPAAVRVRALAPTAYTVEKLLALEEYTATTSAWRVAFVMLVTPIPGLVAALLPALVPMQDPLSPDGLRGNPGYLVSGFSITFIVGLGTLAHWRAGAAISPATYTNCQIVGVAFISAVVQFLSGVVAILLWRFPLPMSWILVSATTGTALTIAHIVVFRDRCWHDTELIDGIKRYIPALSIQAGQIVLYPAFSVLFDNVTPLYQVLLTLAFPLLKHLMKKTLRKHTHQLKDFSAEVAVTGIEICASLYQSMILQNAPSQVALVIIMAIDVLQGLLAVKFFMDQPSRIPQHQIVRDALKELQAFKAGGGSGATKSGWVGEPGNAVVPLPTTPAAEQEDLDTKKQLPPKAETPTTQTTEVESIAKRRVSQKKKAPVVVTEALELVAVAESILLVEYLEVAIPLVNALFIAVACQFNGAQFNTRLRHLYFYPDVFASAIRSILFYSFLQALSFIAMHFVMRYRYGLSATYHLAFVLERHRASIVGKMVGWLPIILHFTVVHFGVDFSFRFDFAALLRGKSS